jgi:hypothetical protein
MEFLGDERLVLGISDAVWIDGEDGLTLGQAGTVVHLADALLTPSLPTHRDSKLSIFILRGHKD